MQLIIPRVTSSIFGGVQFSFVSLRVVVAIPEILKLECQGQDDGMASCLER